MTGRATRLHSYTMGRGAPAPAARPHTVAPLAQRGATGMRRKNFLDGEVTLG
jgi:hypothetical protein